MEGLKIIDYTSMLKPIILSGEERIAYDNCFAKIVEMIKQKKTIVLTEKVIDSKGGSK